MDVDTGHFGPQSGSYGTIAFLTGDGCEVQANIRHLGRHEVSFEVVSTDAAVRASEVLTQFRVTLGGHLIYSGRATTTAVTPAGTVTVCTAALDEAWTEPGMTVPDPAVVQGAFDGFMDYWQKQSHIRPEFKVVVADMQCLLADLELWLARFEDLPSAGRDGELDGRRIDWARALGGRTTPTLNALFEKFETAAAAAEPGTRAACRTFARRQLHPLLLCSPFLHRTYRKPLGYAGDYEMVNMISREPYEGKTLFAKLINLWFLAQPPAQAHRNRLRQLEQRLTETVVRASADRRRARVLSLGCGPAVEIQQFLRHQTCTDPIEITLLDFNEETLVQTRGILRGLCERHRRADRVATLRKSVMGILRESQGRGGSDLNGQYDFVYCAGLFDYLTDPVCRRLSTQMYEWLRPGGLFLSTNVHVSNPWPMVMDFIMDWHLNYRTAAGMLATRPEQVEAENCVLTTDASGVNIFLETRKPEAFHRGIR